MKKISKLLLCMMMLFTLISPNIYANETKIKIACIGDSLTDGFLSSGGNKSATAYPAQLQQLLGDQYEVGNFGKTSYTLMKGTDKSYWNSTEFTNSKNFLPNYVIIMLGTNDCKEMYWNEEQYKADAKALYDTYANLSTKPHVVFALAPHVYGSDRLITTERVNMLHEVQLELVAEMNWDSINMYDLTADKEYLYHSDKLHFSDEGYHYLAQCMYEKIIGHKHPQFALNEAISTYQTAYVNLFQYTADTYEPFKVAYEAVLALKENASTDETAILEAVALLNQAGTALEEIIIPPLSSALIPQNDIKVIGFSSQCVVGGNPSEDGEATNLLDGDELTYWHSDWKNMIGVAQYVSFDLGKVYTLSDLTLLPRKNQSSPGAGDPLEIKLYGGTIAQDLTYIGSYAFEKNGNVLANRDDYVRAYLSTNPQVRYLKVEVVNMGGNINNRYTCFAELRFYGSPVAEKTLLKEKIAEAKTYEKESYTLTSWTHFENALLQAETIDAKVDATQTEVDQVIVLLNGAIAQLEEKPPLPQRVLNVKVNVVDYKTIQLTWDASEDATSYDIYRKSYKPGSEFKLVQNVNTNEATFTSLMTGKYYTFYIVAKNETGEAQPSINIPARSTLLGTCDIQNNGYVSQTRHSFKWNKVEGATRYIIYRKREKDPWKKILTLDGNTFTYTTSELPQGTYSFTVRAARYDSVDRIMTDQTSYVKVYSRVSAPELKVKAGVKKANLSWKKVEGVTYYEIYRATSYDGKFYKLATTKNLSYTASKLTSGKEYYFRLRGYKTYDNGTSKKKIYSGYSTMKLVVAE